MAKRCIYCKTDLSEDVVVDVCDRCGVGVWGPKMFQAIKDNMEGAKRSGDLYQGSVSTSPNKKPEPKKSALGSIATEALATQNARPVERQLDSYPKSDQKNDFSKDPQKSNSASFLVDNAGRF